MSIDENGYFISDYPDGYTLEHALDGGKQLECCICNTTKSYSGSSQKLIAEAFYDSGWRAMECLRVGLATCPTCESRGEETKKQYSDAIARGWTPLDGEPKEKPPIGEIVDAANVMPFNPMNNSAYVKPKYDYGCSVVHPGIRQVIPKTVASYYDGTYAPSTEWIRKNLTQEGITDAANILREHLCKPQEKYYTFNKDGFASAYTTQINPLVGIDAFTGETIVSVEVDSHNWVWRYRRKDTP